MAIYTLTDTGNTNTNGQWLVDICRGTNVSGQNGSLTQVAFGDTIKLIGNVTYTLPTSNLVLPPLGAGTGTDADYITIETSLVSSLASDRRTKPLVDNNYYAKIVGKGSDPVINCTEAGSYSGGYGAHHWKFIGLDITNDGTVFCPFLVVPTISYPTTRDIAYSTHHFIIDRCFIHPKEYNVASSLVMPFVTSASKAIVFGARYLDVKNSHVVGAGPFEGYLYGTDLVIDASNNTKVTSASHTFVSGDVGQELLIYAGTNFTKCRRTVSSVSSGAAILSGAAGTTGATGGSWGLGYVGSGMAVVVNTGLGDVNIDNNYLHSNYNCLFFAGSDNLTPNTGTISASSINLGAMTGTATLSNVTNLAIGRYVAFQTTSDPAQGYTRWHSGKVTAIAGNNIEFQLKNGSDNIWSTAPYVTGLARWVGDNIQNINIRRNYFQNMPENMGTQEVYDNWNFYPKGYCEVKDGSYMLWEGNVFNSSMNSVLAFYPNNQNATQPWVICAHNTVRNNICLAASAGFPWLPLNPSYAAAETADYTCVDFLIKNNFVAQRFQPVSQSYAVAATPSGGSDARWLNNTYINTVGSIMYQVGTSPVTASTFKDNICSLGLYGFNADSGPVADAYDDWEIKNNLLINSDGLGRQSFVDVTNNVTPTNFNQVGFEDIGNNNYQILNSSAYATMSSIGGKPGVIWATLYNNINEEDWPFSWDLATINTICFGLDF